MITVCCIVFAVLAAGMFTEMIAASSAPLGYQDETGFHFGREITTSYRSFDLENPS